MSSLIKSTSSLAGCSAATFVHSLFMAFEQLFGMQSVYFRIKYRRSLGYKLANYKSSRYRWHHTEIDNRNIPLSSPSIFRPHGCFISSSADSSLSTFFALCFINRAYIQDKIRHHNDKCFVKEETSWLLTLNGMDDLIRLLVTNHGGLPLWSFILMRSSLRTKWSTFEMHSSICSAMLGVGNRFFKTNLFGIGECYVIKLNLLERVNMLNPH